VTSFLPQLADMMPKTLRFPPLYSVGHQEFSSWCSEKFPTVEKKKKNKRHEYTMNFKSYIYARTNINMSLCLVLAKFDLSSIQAPIQIPGGKKLIPYHGISACKAHSLD
jgi:hypothetical protein